MTRRKSLRGSASILRRVLLRVSPHLRKQRSPIAFAFAALFLGAAMRLLEPWPLKFIFDLITGFAPAEGSGGSPGLLASDPTLLLLTCAFAIPLITGVRALASHWATVGFARIGNRVLTDLRAELYRHLTSLSLSFHSKARRGDLIVRVIGDVGLLKEAAVTALLPLLAHSVLLAGMLVVLLWLHWKLTMVALLVAPIFWLLTQNLTRRIHAVSRRQRRREGAMATTAAESMGAIRVVQSLSLGKSFASVFSRQNEQSFKVDVEGKRLASRLERGVDLLVAVTTGLVVGLGAYLVLLRQLTPGDLLVVATYLRRCFRPLQDFAKYSARLAKAAAAGERVLEVLEQPAEVKDLPGARPAPHFKGAIQFDRVSFAYEPDAPVLQDISLRIAPGQCVAVIGSAGAGKSTLASLLLRLHDPTSGRVTIDDVDIREYTIESLRRQMGIVLQDTVLFAGTVRENIAYGREGASDSEIEEAARLIGADRFIGGLRQKYETAVGERGMTLSAGQCQLIAACRAAIRNAAILIFDEPTAALDGENERMVNRALDRLARDRTTLLITHDLERAMQADLILHLERGRVLELGTHEDLLRSNGRYAELYRQQALAQAAIEGEHIRADGG
jgi:ATP-binding cassette subfamily B protein